MRNSCEKPSRPSSRAARADRDPIALGRWTLEPDTGLLRAGSDEQRLTGKALHVLLVLIDAGGAAVSRDDLLDKVWGEHYPTDAVVSRAIADLRSAFGESAGDGETIRTIPKFGYQLVASTHPAETSPRKNLAFPIVITVVAGMFSIVLVTALFLLGPGESARVNYALPDTTPLTSAPGIEHQPRFLPGSDWVVYAALRPDVGDWDLFRVSLTDNASQAIAATPGISEHGPAVSPDGESIAYTRLSVDGCDVVVQAVVLGVPETVAHCTTKFPTLVDWSPDGALLAFTASEQDDVDGYRRIHILDRASGTVVASSLDVSPSGSDFYPRFSPSGQQVAFLRGEPQPDHRASLWVLDLELGAEQQITAQPAQLGGMTWLDDDRLLYASNDAGQFEWRRYNLRTGSNDSLGRRDLVHPQFDASRKRLVAAVRRSERDLLVLSASGEPASIGSSTSDDHHAQWSPDGSSVVFVSRRSGHDELWLATGGSPDARRLTRFDGATVRYPAWHPNGRRILFSVQTGSGERLYEIDLITDQAESLDTQSAEATTPAWMANGEQRVYGCGSEGADNLCLSDGGAEIEIGKGLFRPVPQSDGTIVALDRQGSLVRLTSDGERLGTVWDGLPADGRYAWDIGGESLTYAIPGAGASVGRVIQRNLTSGEERLLYEGSMPLADGSIDVAPDGRVVFTRYDAASDDLVWMNVSPGF